MATDNRSAFQRIKDDLRQAADEVRLKVHLGGREAKDLWEKLEPRVAKFNDDAQRASVEMADGISEIGAELKAELEKLRAKLKG